MNEVDVAGEAFVTNIASGLVVMAVEILLVVVLLGLLLKYLENRKWNRTRQLLAYLLIELTESMVGYTENTIEVVSGEGKRIVLNGEIELHLLKLRTLLISYNENIVVYLPSLHPELSEGLSKITSQIPELEQVVISLQHYLSPIKFQNQFYDEENKDKGWVDGDLFKTNEEKGHMELAEGVELSDDNFFAVALIEIFRRAIEVSRLVDECFGAYKNFSGSYEEKSWIDVLGIYSTRKSVREEVEINIKCERLEKLEEFKKLYSQMRTHGIYLVLYLPDHYGTSPNQREY